MKDLSTLAALHPGQPRDLHYRGHKNSLRAAGSHYMTLRRPSRTPESGREYVAGDPVNLIDWKAFARTDQLIIREVRDEATARILIILDLSATMWWPDAAMPRAGTVATKAEIALRVGLNLAHTHLRLGDLVEIRAVFAADATRPDALLQPRRPSDVVALFERLALNGFNATDCRAAFDSGVRGSERPFDTSFWLGDGLGSAAIAPELALGRRSLLLHVLSSLEIDTSWVENSTSYFDEGITRKEYQGQVLLQRGNYAQHLAAWRQKLAQSRHDLGGGYALLTDATPIAALEGALAELVAQPPQAVTPPAP